jgi:hypothetical protein
VRFTERMQMVVKMNYNSVITFPGRKQSAFRGPRDGGAVLPSMTTPLIDSLEQSPTNGSKETPAKDDEVLFEQLAYLIRFADQELDRLARVKAILLETFN